MLTVNTHTCDSDFIAQFDTIKIDTNVSDSRILELLYNNVIHIRNIKKLICTGSNLSYVPDCFTSLKYLFINNTSIDTIPNIDTLKYVNCSNSNVRNIPKLNNCKILNIENNGITTLPELNSLIVLNAKNNKLSNISYLTKLMYINIENNNFKTVFDIVNDINENNLIVCNTNNRELRYFDIIKNKHYDIGHIDYVLEKLNNKCNFMDNNVRLQTPIPIRPVNILQLCKT